MIPALPALRTVTPARWRYLTVETVETRADLLRDLLPGWSVSFSGVGLTVDATAPDRRHRSRVDLLALTAGAVSFGSLEVLAGELLAAWLFLSSPASEVPDVR